MTARVFLAVLAASSLAFAGAEKTVVRDTYKRMLSWEGVGNARDLGGLPAADGKTIRRRMVYRSQAFNNNAVCSWLTAPRLENKMKGRGFAIEFGADNYAAFKKRIGTNDISKMCAKIAAELAESTNSWKIGKARGTPESRGRILHETGLRTELDLRSREECWGMSASPLGKHVKWINIPGVAIKDLAKPEGRQFFKAAFPVFLDRKNYPINFHCIAGADRTGALAFVLEALLGVSEKDMVGDYVLTSLSNSGRRTAGSFRKMAKAFDSFPGKTLNERVEAYVLDCGFTAKDIAKLRNILLTDGEEKLSVVDLSSRTDSHVFIARGTEKSYQGHPTSVRTADGRTIVVWCTPHGGWCGSAAESSDDGKTWKDIGDRFPKGFRRHVNCPSVYRLIAPDGKARLWVWSQVEMPGDAKHHRDRRWRGNPMPSVMSEDEGLTWKEMPPLGDKFRCVMAFASIVRLKDGSYLGMFHKGPGGADKSPLEVWQSVTKDGGFTWSDPRRVCAVEGKDPCEPFVFRSPDGNELCCIMRENRRRGLSLAMFSRDEGKTWSRPGETLWGLTGDRHQGVRLPDGRFCIVFRDMAPDSPTRGHFVAWVGSYDAIKTKDKTGTYRIKLLHNYATVDCGYPGIHLLDDGTILATTYLKYWNDKRKHSVVSVRFRVDETDRMLKSAPHVKGRIQECGKYLNLNPRFAKAFEFMRRSDLARLSPGRYEIDGTNAWAIIMDVKLKPFGEENQYEVHKEFIDIQAPLLGKETIGVVKSDSSNLKGFNDEKDFALFKEKGEAWELSPGEFAVFFPVEGAHAPGLSSDGTDTVRKLVIKVRK